MTGHLTESRVWSPNESRVESPESGVCLAWLIGLVIRLKIRTRTLDSRLFCYTAAHGEKVSESSACWAGPNELRPEAANEFEESDRRDTPGGQEGRAGCLPTRALSFTVLLPDRRYPAVQTGRNDSRPTTDSLARIARQNKIVIVASLFEKRAAGIYHNTAVTIDANGRLAGKYRKMHIPDDPLYYEKFYFAPGDLGFRTHDTAAGKIGTLVCWDQWFPEAARLTALSGAQFLFYPTAIGWLPNEQEEMNLAQHSAWETIQRAHAIANGVYVVVVNRVGPEGQLNFWGQSFVADPFGRIIAKAAADEEEVLVVDCDLTKIEETRQNWPFLRDRRIDAYSGLAQRFLDPDAIN